MKKELSLKQIVAIILIIGFVVVISFIGPKTYTEVFKKEKVIPDGTIISSVDLSGLTPDEATDIFQSRLDEWRKNSLVVLQYEDQTVEIPTEMFLVDLDYTIKNAFFGKTLATITMNDDDLAKAIEKFSKQFTIDQRKLKDDLVLIPIIKENGPFTFQLAKYIPNLEDYFEPVSTITVPITQGLEDDVTEWVEKLDKIIVESHKTASLLSYINESNINKNNGALNYITTALYEAILATNFEIQERHISPTLPSYSKLGYEANIDPDKKFDLVISNPNSAQYEIIFTKDANNFNVTVRGLPLENKYVVNVKESHEIKPNTVVQYSARLNLGVVNIEEEGSNGITAKVYRDVHDKTGKIIESQLVSEDYYPPVHRVEVHSIVSKDAASHIESVEIETSESEDQLNENKIENTNKDNPNN